MISETPNQVKVKITNLTAAYEVDEVVVVAITHGFADRLRSDTLLAKSFELPGAMH